MCAPDTRLSVDLCRPVKGCVYSTYVSDAARDMMGPFELTIEEEEGLSAQECLDTRNDLVELGQRASDAGPASQVDELWRQTNRAKQNGSSRRMLADFARCVDSILAGHQEVEYNQVGVKLVGFGNGFVPVGRFATNFPICVVA